MPLVEARIETEKDHTGQYTAGYLYVDGRRNLRWVRWEDGDITFEWDRRIEELDLGTAVRAEIPRLVGLDVPIDKIDIDESGLRVDAEFNDGRSLSVSKPGNEMNLLIAGSLITPRLVGWIVNHHRDPEGMDNFELIAGEINRTLGVLGRIT